MHGTHCCDIKPHALQIKKIKNKNKNKKRETLDVETHTPIQTHHEIQVQL